MLASPTNLSQHQRTTSAPPLSSSFSSHRSARLKTSNPSYHRNQQYSIIGLTNAAGILVERYSYTAYGTLGIYDASGTVRTTSTYANRYTYTGREYDADLNLYHFRARWYDPSTGGFISRDPLGYVDGMSRYRAYFGVSKVDPGGFCKMWPRQDVLSEIDFLQEAINNLPPFQPDVVLTFPKNHENPEPIPPFLNIPRVDDYVISCEAAVAEFLSAMKSDPTVERALKCNVRIYCHENCTGSENSFGGFAYFDKSGPIVCLNSTTLKTYGRCRIGGLLLHELVHVVDLLDFYGCQCAKEAVPLDIGNPPLFPKGGSWGNCKTCMKRERKAYSRQALFYGLQVGSDAFKRFVEAGACRSCKHESDCDKECPDPPDFAITPEVTYFSPPEWLN